MTSLLVALGILLVALAIAFRRSAARRAVTATVAAADYDSEIRPLVQRAVAAGFESPDEIAQTACEILRDEHAGNHSLLVQRIVDEELRRHEREAATWPEVTDCDRLDRAFDALEESGIIARQHFTCCQNCGHTEILDEIEQASREREVRGYTFFHVQDTESAVEGDGLYLAYGATAESDDTTIAIGHEVANALRAAGLRVDWDGQLTRRIRVELDWKRRRDDAA